MKQKRWRLNDSKFIQKTTNVLKKDEIFKIKLNTLDNLKVL